MASATRSKTKDVLVYTVTDKGFEFCEDIHKTAWCCGTKTRSMFIKIIIATIARESATEEGIKREWEEALVWATRETQKAQRLGLPESPNMKRRLALSQHMAANTKQILSDAVKRGYMSAKLQF